MNDLFCHNINNLLDSGRTTLVSILLGVTILFTFFLSQDFVITDNPYQVGDIAKRDIKAPKDFIIEDVETTLKNRKDALKAVPTIYDHDASLLPNLIKKITIAFKDASSVFETPLKPYPPVKPVDNKTPAEAAKNLTPKARIWNMKKDFEEKVGFTFTKKEYQSLINDKFSSQISTLISNILTEILSNGVVANKELLLKESEKGITLHIVGTEKEALVRNLKVYYSIKQAEKMVKIVAEQTFKGNNINYEIRDIVVKIVLKKLHPNISLNRNKTEERKKKVEESIKPTLYEIKEGEKLISEGERVTKQQLKKLMDLEKRLKNENIFTRIIGTALIIVFFLTSSYLMFFQNAELLKINHNKNIMFLATILISFLFIAKISEPIAASISQITTIPSSSMIYGIPITAGVMTICLFIGLDVAMPFALIISIFTAIIFAKRFELFLYFLLSGIFAAHWMQDCRERKVFIKAGAKLGLFNAALAISTDIYMSDFYGMKLLWDAFFGFLGGLSAGIVTAGIAPLVEMLFDYTTDIKLLELANLDQPILRRLMIEAPGTYNHSVIVGTMADSVASEIGASPLLARVCGYYHDIGKLKKPQYFIENQTNGVNKHDKLAPSLSALVIIAHVKDGVEIAQKYKLGKAIVDTIKQHHGTSMLTFFYDKAKQQSEDNNINSEDFRYPGPKPQTREAGIVMLADVVEAASRTLDNPTPARIQKLVQNLINKIFADGQLDYCELTLKDLHSIAKTFHKILSGIYHHRIEYPDAEKEKNGDTGKKQHKKKDSRDDSSEDSNHLKRLGLS
ncbi:MAG: HDIG domain-containing protein [Deltaproteobacteria bacterium]|nr:HDIG domain-containing protein [Deltaproteobacteria bacterium]